MAEIGHCRDCKWWMSNPNLLGPEQRFCGLIEPESRKRLDTSRACIHTCCGQCEVVLTAPDFGCIKFERRADG